MIENVCYHDNNKHIYPKDVILLLTTLIITLLTIAELFSSFSSYYNISFYSYKHNSSYSITNIVWLMWDGNISSNIRYFLHNFKDKLESYGIIYVCNTTIFNYIDKNKLPKGISILPKANQVDYYKFYLAYYYGGIWIDSSTYIYNESFINYFVNSVREKKAMLGAFNYRYHPHYHIETGFLIVPRYSPFVKCILNEIFICVKIGREKYIKQRIKEGIIVKSDYIVRYNNNKRIISPYLYVYVCILTVYQRIYNNNPNILLLRAEDYMYKLLSLCKGNRYCIKRQWEEKKDVKENPILKFNHDNRDELSLPYIEII